MSDIKICTKCKRGLPISEFRWKNKIKGIHHSQCKDCQKQLRDQRNRNASKKIEVKI